VVIKQGTIMSNKTALQDVKVLDFTHVLAGPTCTMILADLGADVIKLEPLHGDDSRVFPPFQNEESAYFMSINRNKRSIAVDLKSDKGMAICKRLVEWSDVIVENFKTTTMKKLGLDYGSVSKIKKDIIYAAVSGFGHTGPYSAKPAYDVVAQAMSGMMSITGGLDGKPVRVGSSIGDIMAGNHAAEAILAALYFREKTGEGQFIDCAMLDGLIYTLENAIVRHTVGGELPRPLGTAHPSISPFQAFKASDRYLIVAAGNDSLFSKLCACLEKQDLAEHEEYKTNHLRVQNREKLAEELQLAFETKTCAEWCEILEKQHIPHGPIYAINEMIEDEQVKDRNMIVETKHPEVGTVRMAGTPYKMSKTPGSVRTPAPKLGEHTCEILKSELNLSDEEIQTLLDEKIIG